MDRGLTAQEAARRLAADGPNELPSAAARSLPAILWHLLREPMLLLLLACGAIYLLLGDRREALLLLGSIGVIIGIELYQEHKTERALEALRDLSSPRALVIRDGRRVRISGREVVVGDWVVLSEGDRVPADGVVRAGEHLQVDESILTGESVPVRKRADASARAVEQPGGEDHAAVFSGTLVVGGQGIAEVLRTGSRTEMGRIGKSLQTIQAEETRIQRETGRLVRIFAWIGLSLCVVAAVLHTLIRGNWLHGLLAGLTLAISMVPEELPVILTVFLALGAWRISRKQVLTRRVPAVEMLGAATVLCADKTGTLTMNRMSVRRMVAGEASLHLDPEPGRPLPPPFHELAAAGVLACRRDPFDPTEQALQGLRRVLPTERRHEDWTLIREHPFSSVRPAVAYAWRSPSGEHVLASKGAPETMARLCRLPHAEAHRAMEAVRAMASDGLRVLAVAEAPLTAERAQASPEAAGLRWLGLIGMADPVRPTVPAAVQECRTAGIRVVMITGDYPVTAQAIAREIGLESGGGVLTGAELDGLDDRALADRVRRINLFARIVPEQKLRLVNALKAHGEIVAMTGDGVNDAPALKAAHIGIAMGARGTDVAREAAALILLDDDFSSIVHAVRIGRRIFDNLKKAMAYVLAVHVPIAGISLIPVVLHWPLVLLPVHIVFLELIIDPACSIAFEMEPEEADVMRRPPRDPAAPVITRRVAVLSLLQGLSVLVIVLGVFAITLWRGKGDLEVRAMTFTSLVVSNLALILANRSWTRTIVETLRERNPAMWWITGGALAVLALVLYVPGLRDLFGFAVLHPDDLAICGAAGLLGVAWFELIKKRPPA